MIYGRIYVVTNLANGKRYVGKTTHSIAKRWKRHCAMYDDYILQRAIAKYGVENFKIEQVETATSCDELNNAERQWIAKLGTMAPIGYNLSSGGEGGSSHPDTRAKLSEIAKERWSDPDFKKKMSAINAAAAASSESRNQRRDRAKIAWMKPEHRAAVKLSQSSDACREKMSLASKSAWSNPEYREKLLVARNEKNKDKEFLKRRGKAISEGLSKPEVKEKLKESMKKYINDPEFLRRRGAAIAAGIARNKAARSARNDE